MEPILQALRIPYQIARKDEEIREAIVNAFHHAYASYYHTAVILAGGTVR